MTFKLSAKIFTAFVAMTLISVVLMVMVIRYASHRNFEDYVHRKEIAQLDSLMATLADFFKEQESWQAFEDDPRLWHRVVRQEGSDGEFIPSPQDRRRPAPPERPPGPPGHKPPSRPGGPRPDSPPPPVGDPLYPGHRVVLFDAQRRHVAGPQPRKIDLRDLQPITLDGRAMGWIGLEPAPRLSHPLDLDFIRQQNRVFYIIGAAILALSVLLAMWLSRHLLAPIRRLTEATRALTLRRFDTRIKVASSDELGQLAHDFNAMARRLGAYELRQQQWLSDISHELRTPVAILISEIEALQDGIRPTDEGTLASLHTEASRLGKIISDLHDLSMGEAGNLTMQLQPLNPISLLTRTLALFDTRLGQHALSLDTQLSSTGKITVNADADRLVQLFSNILENAIQHTTKPGTLKIGHSVVSEALELCFEDSGPGVPHEALPHLFDRLFRVDASRTRDTGGSGLGLSICKQIVEAHNGTIEAHASALGGLALKIIFPCRP